MILSNAYLSRIERLKSSRGGAVMTQNGSGTVYVISSAFVNNFSSTFGAAIYIRSNAVFVKDSEFIENNSNEWVSFGSQASRMYFPELTMPIP